MGVCHSNSNRKSSFPFTSQAKLPNAHRLYHIPETISQNTQIHSKKEFAFSQNLLMDQITFHDLEDLSIGNEEKINIPYFFQEKASSQIQPQPHTCEPCMQNDKVSLKPSNLEEKTNVKIQSPVEFLINDENEYFRPEFLNKVLNDALNANFESYDNYENIYKDTTSPLKMQIHFFSYKSTKNQRINKFRTEFIAPCKAVEYISIANNLEIQKLLDTYCEEYKIIESLGENIKLYYLSYRKNFICSPRDFIYLKLTKQIEKNGKKYWCDAAKSIESDKHPPINKTIRCQIIKSGLLIEDLSDENGPKCKVRIYSECDFKIDLPLFVVRNFSASEMKKFIEKSLMKIKQIYRKKS